MVLDAPKEQVFDYLSRIENLPDWATEFARELKYEDGKAKVVNGLGEFYHDRGGPRDGRDRHVRRPGGGRARPLPHPRRRAARRAERLRFTMFRAPEMTDELFESQYESLLREFDNIRSTFS